MKNVTSIVLSLLTGAVLLSGCASVYQPKKVELWLNQSVVAAEKHADTGRMIESAQLATAVKMIDSDHPGLKELAEQLPDSNAQLYARPMLGSNKALRYPAARSKPARIWLYVPDRILDFLDIVSFDLHMGPSLFVNLHATRAAQAGAGGRIVGGVGWHRQRSLGLQYQTEGGVAVLPFGAQGHLLGSVGTSGLGSSMGCLAGLHRPSSEIYQDYRDYWAVGVSASSFIGIDIDFHPVQLADFIVGWGLVDFLNDDFAYTKGPKFTRQEEGLLKKLNRVVRSERSIALYRNYNKHLSENLEITQENEQ